MPLVFVDRNGHPAAMSAPMLLCDACGHPLHAGQNAYTLWWRTYGLQPRTSQVFFAHSTPQQPCLEQLEKATAAPAQAALGQDASALTRELDPALDQLGANLTAAVGDGVDVEDAGHGGVVQYVAPVLVPLALPADPLSWTAVVRADGSVTTDRVEHPPAYAELRN